MFITYPKHKLVPIQGNSCSCIQCFFEQLEKEDELKFMFSELHITGSPSNWHLYNPIEVLIVVILILNQCCSYRLFHTNENLSHHVGYRRNQAETWWPVLSQHNDPSSFFLNCSASAA